jgi:signal transduction histidine kinase
MRKARIHIGLIFLLLSGMIWEGFLSERPNTFVDHSLAQPSYVDRHHETIQALLDLEFNGDWGSFFERERNIRQDKDLYFYVFKSGQPVYWSDNLAGFDYFRFDREDSSGFVHYQGNLYRFFVQQSSDSIQQFVFELWLQQSQQPVSGSLSEVYKVSGSSLYAELQWDYGKNVPVMGLMPRDLQLTFYRTPPTYYVWLYVLALVLLCFLWYQLSHEKRYRQPGKSWSLEWFILAVFIWIRWAIGEGKMLGSLMTYSFLSPEIYAHTFWASSPAELLLNQCIVYFFLRFVLHAWRLYKGRFSILGSVLIQVVAVLYVYALYLDVSHLIFDSNIHLDVRRTDDLNGYSILGLLIIWVYYRQFKLVAGMVVDKDAPPRDNRMWLLWLGVQVLLWVGIWLFIEGGDREVLMGLWPFMSMGWLALWRGRRWQWEVWLRKLPVGVGLFLIFISCMTWGMHHLHIQKEQEFRRYYADKMLYERDLEMEMRLLEVEQSLEEEQVFELCFYDPGEYESVALEQVLKYEYFLEFMVDFDIDIVSFEGDNRGWSDLERADYDRLYRMYISSMGFNISNHFFKISEGYGMSGYISSHIIGDVGGDDYRAVFVVFRQKFRSSSRMQWADRQGQRGAGGRTVTNPYGYVYAIYAGHQLMRVSPEYPYTRHNTLFRPGQQERFESRDGYSHFMYNPERGKLIVVSLPIPSWNAIFTLFSAMLLFAIVFWVLLWIMRLLMVFVKVNMWRQLLSGRRHSGRRWLLPGMDQLLLQTKIRVSLFALLVVCFGAGTLLVINFVAQNFKRVQQQQLLEKVQSISAELEKSGILDLRNIAGPGIEFLMGLAESYHVDINLFDHRGELMASSGQRNIRSTRQQPLMNPMAFYHMRHHGYFSHYQNEEVGELSFRSYYQSVFNTRRDLAGFIHLPYFSRDLEYRRQITVLLVDILNVFVLFFLFTSLISVFISTIITRPLTIVSEHMKRLRLLGRNEEIAWSSRDELGQLVSTYNRVLRELDENVQKLAETEREGAWREMAKQVAHEIKNPLTPMRLSVQHLQRTVSPSDPELTERIHKISALLVNQIDMMTRMAEEFSSFAKMPEAHPERVDVQELLQEVVFLFDKEVGLELELQPPLSPTMVFADRDQLKRVFVNLVKNAHQAKKEGEVCKVMLIWNTTGQMIELRVSDNGIGINEEWKDRIFSPNFSTKTSGMGLGLAISKKIIELAGGKIRFESVPGKGTDFIITLPALV